MFSRCKCVLQPRMEPSSSASRGLLQSCRRPRGSAARAERGTEARRAGELSPDDRSTARARAEVTHHPSLPRTRAWSGLASVLSALHTGTHLILATTLSAGACSTSLHNEDIEAQRAGGHTTSNRAPCGDVCREGRKGRNRRGCSTGLGGHAANWTFPSAVDLGETLRCWPGRSPPSRLRLQPSKLLAQHRAPRGVLKS